MSDMKPIPFGEHSRHAGIVGILLISLAGIGAVISGRGDIVNTVVNLVCQVVNPMCWAGVWLLHRGSLIRCPFCQQTLKITAEIKQIEFGAELKCPNCSEEFRRPLLEGEAFRADR